MNLFDALANWATGVVTAAVVAALGLGTPGVTVPSRADASDIGILTWAQSVDEETIQQLGEATQTEDADAEQLDAASPPVESASSTNGEITVGQSGDDIELLDQGTPPQETTTTTSVDTTVVEPAASVTVVETAAPAASGAVATDTAVDTGPHLPEGFGEGQVLVSTGSGDFPPGLDECHVGAVTGRAYVGIDCDEEGSSFVGHAPSFEDFPFVTDENFPFDNDDPIVADENFPFGDDESPPIIELGSDGDSGSNVLVAAGGRREGPSVSLPERSEGAVVERAQRAGGETSAEQSEEKSKRNRSTSISVDASSGSSNDRVQSTSKNSKENSRVKNASGNEKKNGKAKHKQKAKKNQDKDKDKKANKSPKSDGKEKKSKKKNKDSRKKNR